MTQKDNYWDGWTEEGLLEVDLSDVQAAFEPLPVGNYPVVVTEVSRQEGPTAPYLAFRLSVLAPPQYQGRALFDNVSTAPRARWKLKQVLTALLGPEEANGLVRLDINALVGRQAIVTVSHRTYQGQVRNDIVRWTPMSAATTYSQAVSIPSPPGEQPQPSAEADGPEEPDWLQEIPF